MPTRRQFLAASLAAPLVSRSLLGQFPQFSIEKNERELTIKSPTNQPVATYVLQPPKNTKLPVDSACFFHPLYTPARKRVTDLAPPDHPHHRGVFLAFVETHAKTPDGKTIDADFWGWGQPAPIKNRQIAHEALSDLKAGATQASFRAKNLWRADGQTLLIEDLQATVRPAPGETPANILDLTYTLTPLSEMTLAGWAFSGFCARAAKEGYAKLTAAGPDGPIPTEKLPNPSHLKPDSDWPDAPWYAYELSSDAGGAQCGLAVVNHAQNPKTLWHNHRDIRMLNPCIVAPGPVTLRPDKPLTLKYQVVAFDGITPTPLLNNLARG
jgi:Methane oxygenase PmoA